MAEYSYNSLYLTKNGRPWFPVMGEMHYSRYPNAYWRESIYKMMAGGVDILSCYAIWIHHEEEEGQFDFSGDRNLRGFLQTAGECGIKVLLRIGPWAHGEVRNGGFPDWLLQKGIPLRCNDPAYLSLVKRYYEQLALQARGLLDKDGGPVIGVQIENEYGHVGGLQGEEGEQHMRTLKALAIEAGFDVPLYTATGWGGAVTGGMLPVMGGYCDAPWDQRLTEIEPSGNYIFTPERNDHNIGSDYGFGHGITFDLSRFPFLTAELGGGLQVTHHRRPVAKGRDVAAMSLVKMGSGCNLLGYYMYHGGTNPDGKLSSLQESRATGYPNDLPIKSYDFNAPIREFGQLSDSFREIRLLSSFIHDFGEDFCRMEPRLPSDNPLYPSNRTDLRYTVRHNGKSGYLFVNNYQRRHPMAEHRQVSLQVTLDNETVSFPPFDVKDGEFFFFPVRMPLGDRAVLKTALAAPLCRLNQNTWVFYGDRDPQFETEGDLTGITLLSLSREEALTASKVTLDREYLILSDSDVIPMADGLHFYGSSPCLRFRTWPMLTHTPDGFTAEEKDGFGIYTRTMENALHGISDDVIITELASGEDITEAIADSRAGGIRRSDTDASAPAEGNIPDGYNRDGTVYRLTIPGCEQAQNTKQVIDAFLLLSFAGDRLEVYQNGTLISDSFYTGQQAAVGLKRFGFPTELIIKLFAYHDGDPVYLETRPKTAEGKACALTNAALVPQWELTIPFVNM